MLWQDCSQPKSQLGMHPFPSSLRVDRIHFLTEVWTEGLSLPTPGLDRWSLRDLSILSLRNQSNLVRCPIFWNLKKTISYKRYSFSGLYVHGRVHDLVGTQAVDPLGDTGLEVPPNTSWRLIPIEYSLDLQTIGHCPSPQTRNFQDSQWVGHEIWLLS